MACKKVRQQNGLKATQGQALIEFVLGLMIILSFFFFYVKMTAVFAIGNYVHYATFMAARAYASSDQSEDAQKQNAEGVMQKMVAGRWKAVIKSTGGNSAVPGVTIGGGSYYQADAAADTWNQGVTYDFSTTLSFYPWSRTGQSVNLKLTSESWMEREESSDECKTKKDRVSGLLASANGGSEVAVEWDNGL